MSYENKYGPSILEDMREFPFYSPELEESMRDLEYSHELNHKKGDGTVVILQKIQLTDALAEEILKGPRPLAGALDSYKHILKDAGFPEGLAKIYAEDRNNKERRRAAIFSANPEVGAQLIRGRII